MKYLFIISSLMLSLFSCGQSQVTKAQEEVNDLNENIMISSKKFEEENKDKIQAVLDKIEAREGTEENEKLKLAIHKIKSLDRIMQAVLVDAIGQAEVIAEINPKTGRLANPGEIEGSIKLFLGENPGSNGGEGNGLAFKIKEKFTWVTDELNSIRKDWGGEPLLSPTFPHVDVEGSWAHQTFANKPVVAALAMLEKYKLDLGNMIGTTVDLLD